MEFNSLHIGKVIQKINVQFHIIKNAFQMLLLFWFGFGICFFLFVCFQDYFL